MRAVPRAARGRATPPDTALSRRSSSRSCSRCGLAVVQLVVLKMLPFDNKSEFQVLVNLPRGHARRRRTARRARRARSDRRARARGHRLSGLRGHRRADQLQRSRAPVLPARRARARRPAGEPRRQAPAAARKSHEIALAVRPALAAIGKQARRVRCRWSRCRRGRRCRRRSSPRSTGPRYAGQRQLATARARAVRRDARHRRRRRQHRGARAARSTVDGRSATAALLGVTQR